MTPPLTASECRALFGCLWAVGGCTIAIRIGAEPERRAAILMLLCWVATTSVQMLTRHMIEPVLVGDFAYGLGLLWLAARYNQAWTWFMIFCEACLFFLHAGLYQAHVPRLGVVHVVVNDVIALAGPAVLVCAALRSRSQRRGSPPLSSQLIIES
jgi:hypothetical protein